MMFLLAGIAVFLTCTMFATRQSLLGFPSAIFWAIFGAYMYTLSAAVWDIYYFVFFASSLGMTVFTAFAAYGLRERRDTIADEEVDEEGEGEGGLIDESEHKPKSVSLASKPSSRTAALRERAKKRRESRTKKTDWGEFK